MIFRRFSNGFEIATEESRFAQVVAIHLMVKVGSLHENPTERGLSHFIEHMLFKGTPTRGVGEISRQVEALGGDINAYTSFDRTVYYLTLPSVHMDAGLEILHDAIFQSIFDREEVEKEQKVILEEISRSADNPGVLVGRPIFRALFAGTEAHRPIIGFESQVKNYKREDLWAFYKKYYVPNNMTCIVVGDFATESLHARLEQLYGNMSSHNNLNLQKAYNVSPVTFGVDVLKGDFQQPRLEVAYRGPRQDDPDVALLDLAAFALGSGDASRLTQRLCHKNGLVSSIGASIFAPKMNGIFHISALTEKDQYLRTVEAIAEEMVKILHVEPITAAEMDRARHDLQVGRYLRNETVSGKARSIEAAILSQNRQYYDRFYEEIIESASVEDVTQALTRWISLDKARISCLLPSDSKLEHEEIHEAYEKGLRKHRASGIKGRVLKKGVHKQPVLTKKELLPGLTLVHREYPAKCLSSIVCVTEGGQRAEPAGREGCQHALASMLAYGPSSMDYEAFLEQIEGTGSTIEGFSGKDSFGLRALCLPEKLPLVGQILGKIIDSPAFRPEHWQAERRDIEQTFRSQEDSAPGLAMRAFQKLIFPGHPYGNPLIGTREAFGDLTTDFVKQYCNDFFGGGPWVVSAVTHEPVEHIENLVLEMFESLQLEIAPRNFHLRLNAPVPGERKDILLEREQTHIITGVSGVSWGDPDRAALDVLATVLGGSGGRLFTKLRDDLSLAYSVSPLLSYAKDGGAFGAYIACAPAKAERAHQELQDAMMGLRSEAPTPLELERAIEYIAGNHVRDLQRPDAQALTMGLMEVYGYGHDDFLKYLDMVRQVTGNDLLRVAKRLLEYKPISVWAGAIP